jgi:hypothetical protein
VEVLRPGRDPRGSSAEGDLKGIQRFNEEAGMKRLLGGARTAPGLGHRPHRTCRRGAFPIRFRACRMQFQVIGENPARIEGGSKS